ncbi:MAG: DUF4351 domain-containing protein, partial [Magnetococcales bacterium]|nr:DUF4351 domain-containing protein [Magnetococcales bacterium]
FRFIDWVLHLPEELDDRLFSEIVIFEENQKMPYISSVERIGEKRGVKKGRQEGKVEMLTSQLQRRFGSMPEWASERLSKADLPSLENWSLRIFDAQSLDDVFSDKV